MIHNTANAYDWVCFMIMPIN